MTLYWKALLAAGLALAVSGAAEARDAYRPLIVKKRSFLDAGRVVPPGSIATWSTASTMTQPVWSYNERFRPNLPGRFAPWP